jgi:hypothetical protein
VPNDPHPDDPFRPASPPTEPFAAAPQTDPFAPPVTPVQPVQPVTTVAPAGSSSVAANAPRPRSTGAGVLVNVLLGVALVVAVGGVAFAAGRATAPAAVAANGGGDGRFGNGGQFFGPNASGAPGGDGNGGRAGGPGGILTGGGLSIEGTVTAVAADSITLQLANGQSVTIPVDAATTYHTQSAATASDVKNGSTVLVQLDGGRGVFTGNGNNGNGNGNGGAGASGQPRRTLPTARSITLAPAGS